jgi:uncharacterized membrane protein (UPF0127 family)
MDRGKWLTAAGVGLLFIATVLVVLGNPVPAPDSDYEWATVTIEDENGARLATVDVRIADTVDKRRLGLSNTSSLPEGEGMLFVHEAERELVYVMRKMDFPLDIVFVDAEGRITTIRHAPVPEEIPDGNGRFPGRGKYVLEVPRGYTNATGVDVGDRVEIPASVDQ